MGLETKLDQVCTAAGREAKRSLGRHTKDLAKLIAAVLTNQRWEYISAQTERHLKRATDSALEAAELADAVDYVNEKLLKAPNGRVVDLKMRRDLRALQQQIRDLFETKEAPARGFVYVAWSARPERVMYVGKAGNVDRLNLAAHGKLAHAAAHVTTLSLLFPSQSRDEILLGLEASVIRLIKFWLGESPELNEMLEVIPDGMASETLRLLAQFLGERADEMHPGD